ncbi:MAG: glycosyltransferase family A protein [Pseudomonadota bacterium]
MQSQEGPLVAVVTPAYNGAPWLERTIASVQNQSYPNIVHVILDNASTDETPDMIERAAGGPKEIITKRNIELLPQVKNWNEAISMTPPEATYVKFNAADDLMRFDCIEKMVALAESDPEIDFVHAIDVFGDNAMPHGLETERSIYDGDDYARRYLRREIPWLSATHVFFRASAETLNEPFPYDIFPLMDNDFIMDKLLRRKMGYVFEPLLFTRYTEQGETARLGGFRSYFLPGFELLLRHGPRLFADDEFLRLKKSALRMLRRHMLYWQSTGDKKTFETVSEGLLKSGISTGVFDYADAVLSWPAHKWKKSKLDGVLAAQTPTESIPETAFLPVDYRID